MHVEELAPDVRPTAGLDDVAAGEQLLKPGIAVGVDDAAEVFEMGPRVLTLAIGRVEEQRCRGPFTAKRSLITHVRPQSASLGLAGARRQHRHRRVVDVQRVRGDDLGGQRIDQVSSWTPSRAKISA
jgi:hypothetical protein